MLLCRAIISPRSPIFSNGSVLLLNYVRHWIQHLNYVKVKIKIITLIQFVFHLIHQSVALTSTGRGRENDRSDLCTHGPKWEVSWEGDGWRKKKPLNRLLANQRRSCSQVLIGPLGLVLPISSTQLIWRHQILLFLHLSPTPGRPSFIRLFPLLTSQFHGAS